MFAGLMSPANSRHRGSDVKGIDDQLLSATTQNEQLPVGSPLCNQNEELVLAAKPHEVGMAVLALIVEDLGDSERREGLRVEGD